MHFLFEYLLLMLFSVWIYVVLQKQALFANEVLKIKNCNFLEAAAIAAAKVQYIHNEHVEQGIGFDWIIRSDAMYFLG